MAKGLFRCLGLLLLNGCALPGFSPAVTTPIDGQNLFFAPNLIEKTAALSEAAEFEPRRSWTPDDLVMGDQGEAYVADTQNHRILKLLPSGLIEVLAGNGRAGQQDGASEHAELNLPTGLFLDQHLWWADQGSSTIRFYDFAAQKVQSLKTEPLGNPIDLLRWQNRLFVGDVKSGRILEVLSDGTLQQLYQLQAHQRLRKLGLSAQGQIFFIDNTGLFLLYKNNPEWDAQQLIRVPEDMSLIGDAMAVHQPDLSFILSEPYQHRLVSWKQGKLTSLYTANDFSVNQEPALKYPAALSLAPRQDRFVLADLQNKQVRLVMRPEQENTLELGSDWQISTLAKNGTQGFGFRKDGEDLSLPHGLVFDRLRQKLLVSDFFNHRLLGFEFSNGQAQATPMMTREMLENDLDLPTGLAQGPDGSIFVSSSASQQIHRLLPDGQSSVVAGSGEIGFVDGEALKGRFLMPFGLDLDAAGNLYIADHGNHSIRKLSPSGELTTIAGTGLPGFRNGLGTQAQFYYPSDVLVLDDGSILVADSWNNQIRRIHQGQVESWAGDLKPDFVEGPRLQARFYLPSALVKSKHNHIYVADTWNHRVRVIYPDGKVSTLAGQGKWFNLASGGQDGPGNLARFHQPRALALGEKVLYVADTFSHRIREIQLP